MNKIKNKFQILLLMFFFMLLLSCQKSVQLGGNITVYGLQIEDWSNVKSAVLLNGAMPGNKMPNFTRIPVATKIIGRFVLDYSGGLDKKDKSITLTVPSNLKNDKNISLNMGAQEGDLYKGLSLYVTNTTMSNDEKLKLGNWSRIFTIKDTVKISKKGKVAIRVEGKGGKAF